MTLITKIFCLLGLLSAMVSSVAIPDTTGPIEKRAIANTTQEFKIQICLKDDEADPNHLEGLWLNSYHTGAGLSDVTFGENGTFAPKAYINYTDGTAGTVVFDLGTQFPWGFVPNWSPAYAAWTPMEINAGSTEFRGFSINETGLQYNGGYFGNSTESFNSSSGWLVCNWWHQGLPQLFWLHAGYNFTQPSSCSQVNLIPRYI